MPRVLSSRVLLASQVAALGAVFVWPATRETQILICRVVLHRPGSNLELHASGLMLAVPNAQFSTTFRTRLESQVQCPDDYVIARCILVRRTGFPSADQWRGHALAGWAVLNAANDRASPSHETSRRGAICDTIHMLQQSEPQDGGLWLAEAVMLFHDRADEAALQATWTAINRREWTSWQNQSRRPAQALLQARGLPELEARRCVVWWGWMNAYRMLVNDAAEGLLRMATGALQDGDRERGGELIYTALLLGQVAHDAVGVRLELEDNPGFTGLLELAADACDDAVPTSERYRDYHRLQAARRQMFGAYLDGFVGGPAGSLFREESERADAEGGTACDSCELQRSLFSRGLPGIAGQLAILLFCLWLAGALGEVPFMAAAPQMCSGRDVYPLSFLPILAATGGVIFAVLASGLVAIVGHGTTDIGSFEVPDSAPAVFLGLLLVVPVVGLRRVFVWHPGWYRSILLVVLVAYLGALWWASETRHQELAILRALPWG